ncbi:hypothetical protein [Povalibacter sp.]|uniref:hypothetical protein n=1 Tax=Povalibacter sp. TaxID=1962978 RepID=UPI002F3FC1E1
MKRSLSSTAVIAAALMLLAQPARAYIDPGTGSALFYVISGIVVSLYFSIRSLYYRVVESAFRLRYKDQSCGIAIHCEDPRYEITFLPIIAALSRRGISSTFFTMYERGESFEPLPEDVVHKAIAPGMVGYAYLNNLEAVLLVTTTPQLDVMTFRRSRRVRHYAIVQHAVGESRYVRPYAYDYFDSVLCCGEILKNNIRRMESIRGSAPKNLYETGLPHYEALLANARATPLPPGDPVVLVAPSWGPLSMFEAFGTDFIAGIARRFKVIVRPHPQMKVSQPDLYARILALEGVVVDTSRTPAAAMSQAHVLLSDISGITHEFAFIYERPVVIIDRQQTNGGLEGELLGGDSELKQCCRDFIVPVPPSEINEIATHLERVLSNPSAKRIAAVRSRLIYNFGTGSKVAAEQLAGIFMREQQSVGSKKARGLPVSVVGEAA